MGSRAPESVLVLNAGSSSLKFAVYRGAALEQTLKGQIEGLGGQPRVSAQWSDGRRLEPIAPADGVPLKDAGEAMQALLEGRLGLPLVQLDQLVAVGHRVVHGGTAFHQPLRITHEVLGQLRGLIPLAPLHQPHNLAPVQVLLDRQPSLPQVACFDTAFHRTQPMRAEIFALPRSYYDEGIRRYGFHGLSYEHVARALEPLDPCAHAGRTIVAHLGNGVSLCALQGGRSMASTMGFTALDGCPMGTRTGSIDPGVILHLARAKGMSIDQIEDLLYRRSGLLGLSGLSNDMRVLEASDSPGARLAIEVFVYRLVREIGSLAAALGGLDALVFTAGIGEYSARIRQAVCACLGWLGVAIDAERNEHPGAGPVMLATVSSAVRIWRIPTDEERRIALHTQRVVSEGQ
jgi:acetate kinase